MPIYFFEVLYLSDYVFALFFLFLSFALFLELQPRSQIFAFILSGAAFGGCVLAKDAFFVFIPWFVVCAFVYSKAQSRVTLRNPVVSWFVTPLRFAQRFLTMTRLGVTKGDRLSKTASLKQSVLHVILFCIALGIVYSIPALPSALEERNILSVLPTHRSVPSPEEFYGDLYTYEFDREWFESTYPAERESQSTIRKLRNYNRLVSFGVGEVSLIDQLTNGAWLTITHIPDLFLQETVGGFFLWLFILPGMFFLYYTRCTFFWMSLGLIISTELLIRFGLHFQRIHVMNYAWLLAIFAAIGIDHIMHKMGSKHALFQAVIVVFIALQLLQANRLQLAKLYSASKVPQQLADNSVLEGTPQDSIVAFPIYSGNVREGIVFLPQTLERILEQGKLPQAFDHYGVTHVIHYEDGLASRVAEADSTITILPSGDASKIKPKASAGFTLLLHIFR